MRGLALGIAACFGLGTFVVADDKEDLAKAAQKAAEMESYAFTMKLEIEGFPMPMDPMEFSGKYQKDVATYVTGSVPMMGGDFEAYRKGKKAAFKGADGEWQSPKGRGMGMGMMGRNLQAPHEDLKDLDTKFKDIKKTDQKESIGEKECAVYVGDLTEEAAKQMGGMFGAMGGMGNSEMTGTGKWWVDGDGVIRKIELTANVALSMQGEDRELKIVRSTEITDIGSTKVEIPDEAKPFLEEKKEDGK